MNFFIYTGLSFLYSFFILSIFLKELPLSLWYGSIFEEYLFTGRRAVYLSISLLFLTTFMIFIKTGNLNTNFDFITFFQSFLFGLPVAIIMHRLSSLWIHLFSSIEGEKDIVERKITVGSFILWMIPGLIAGAIFSLPLYFISGSFVLAGAIEILIAVFVAFLGARTSWI